MTSSHPASNHPGTAESSSLTNLKRLIWLYFWLLMFEGALRKWIVPQLSGPLLIIRDPVLLLCYMAASAQGRFPKNGLVVGLFLVGALSVLISFVQIAINSIPSTWAITLYGFHANFLHLPLIFIIAETFKRRDIEVMGKWLLLLAPGMAIIVFMQFRSAPSAWINLGAGVGAEQIGAAVNGIEKVRPAGLFSYNTGLGAYLALTAAFGLHYFFQDKTVLNKYFGTLAMGCVAIMLPLSVSRSTIIGVILVILTAVLCGLSNPALWKKSLKIITVGGAAVLVLASWSVLKEGTSIMTTRFANLGIHLAMEQARQPRIVHVGYGCVERVLATSQTGHADVTPTQRRKGFNTKVASLWLVIGFEHGSTGHLHRRRHHIDHGGQANIA